MRKLFLFLCLFAVLGGLSWWYLGVDSYVQIRAGAWIVQLQLLTALLLLVVSVWAINFIGYFISETLGGRWAARSRARRSNNRLRKGIYLLFAGKAKAAKEQFLRGANTKHEPLTNSLLAAHAALESEQYDRALNILNNLSTSDAAAYEAVLHSKANVLFILDRLDEAEKLCQDIKKLQPKDHKSDLLLLEIAEKRKDWTMVQSLLPKLRNREGIRQRVAELEKRVGVSRLRQPGMTRPEYDAVVDSIPPEIKNTAEVVELCMHYLIRCDANKEAEKLLREFLHNEWRPDLLRDYIAIPKLDREKQLTQLQKWHHRHGDSPELLSALQELSDETGDWRAAQDYSRISENT